MAYNVAHFLAQQAVAQPTAAAVRAPVGHDGSGAIRYVARSFSELEAEAAATAHYFTAAGIQRGTRVLLMVRPGLDLIRIVFALFKMGAVPIVIDPGMGLKKFLRCVRHSQPAALVGITPAIWIARLFRPSFQGVTIKLGVGRGFEQKIDGFKSSGSFAVVDSAVDELAAILFTSGSTGPAKGVCYAHGMFLAQVNAIRQQYMIQPGEIDLPMLPVFALFNPALGMCTVVPNMNPSRPATVDPAQIVRAIEQNSVTNSFGSPALWTKIARYCERESIVLPSVRRILMAGAPVPPALMQQMRTIIPNGEIHTPYGATEALPVSSISASEVLQQTAARTQLGEGTCVGRPLPNVAVRVIQPVDGPITVIDAVQEVPAGAIGEIIVQGPSVTRAYDQLEQADADAKIADAIGHWHRMGDMGWLDAEGRLWFCGRKVERVLTASGAMYTDCCEAIFNAHPQVFRSALIDLGEGRPGVVIEPEKTAFPSSGSARASFIKSLKALAMSHTLTAPIQDFFFERSFPVDVRHNAKIHRLSLARKFATK
ncbi:fatty acid CoA ligase family protein [Coraliomargarita sp. SDUM461004]|uniref:Fatty acid CoA ligase family protein n=1 Tax=Thalassobacterium sedimentorum TaxID=3041258 RepID=A0ABU1AFU9_9BACT|nr:fatty acid CoA ligase family protein [Coraliomargarita sp. SDUM461004]MDQ8193552.1 fatty acid CoA ligase family protein [Coraliomargarita sp. SDUM461004]